MEAPQISPKIESLYELGRQATKLYGLVLAIKLCKCLFLTALLQCKTDDIRSLAGCVQVCQGL